MTYALLLLAVSTKQPGWLTFCYKQQPLLKFIMSVAHKCTAPAKYVENASTTMPLGILLILLILFYGSRLTFTILGWLTIIQSQVTHLPKLCEVMWAGVRPLAPQSWLTRIFVMLALSYQICEGGLLEFLWIVPMAHAVVVHASHSTISADILNCSLVSVQVLINNY